MSQQDIQQKLQQMGSQTQNLSDDSQEENEPDHEYEKFDKINKLLQKAELQILSKERDFGQKQLKQKQDLLPYANLLQKIFQGFRMIYKKVQKIPINKQINPVDYDPFLFTHNSYFSNAKKQQLAHQKLQNSTTLQLPNIKNLSNSNIKIDRQNRDSNGSIQNDQQFTPMTPQQQQQQQQFIFQQQQQLLQQQQQNKHFSSTDGFRQKSITANSHGFLLGTQQKNFHQDMTSQRQNTQSTTYTSNFGQTTGNFNTLKQKQQQIQQPVNFEGDLGGVLLDNENQTAFTEILYDENVVQFKRTEKKEEVQHQKTVEDKFQMKKKVKHQSKQFFRRKNYDDRPKLLAHKGTDTGEDFQNAMKDWDYPQRLQQLKQSMEESEENIKELTKYIDEQQKISHKGYSSVDQTLEEYLKGLKQRQFDNAQFFAKSNFDQPEGLPEEANLSLIKRILDHEFTGVQKETALVIFDYINMVLKERELRQQQQTQLLQQQLQQQQAPPKKGKKGPGGTQIINRGGGEKDQEKGESKEDLMKKIKELEKNQFENSQNLDQKEQQLVSLQQSIQEKEREINKIKHELQMSEKMFLNSATKQDELRKQNIIFKKDKDQAEHDKQLYKGKVQESEKHLLNEKNKIKQFEQENKQMKTQIDVIKQLTAKMSPAEKAQINELCEMILKSDLSDSEKDNALQQIRNFYKKKRTKGEQKAFHQMLSKQLSEHSSVKGSQSEYSEIDSDERRKKRLLKNNLAGKIKDLNSDHSILVTPRDVDEPVYHTSPKKKIQVVETLADGTKVIKEQEIFEKNFELGNVVKGDDGQLRKVVGYEKKKILQKTTKKVMKKRIVKNEDGEDVEEEYETEEEVEEEIEIEVPKFEDYTPPIKNKSKQNQNNSKKQQQINKLNSKHNLSSQQNQNQQQNQHHLLKNKVEKEILVEKEVEEEVEEIHIDENGNKIVVKKKIMVKKKVLEKVHVDPTKIKRTASGREYIEESNAISQQQYQKIQQSTQQQQQNIKQGKAIFKKKVLVRKQNSKGQMVEVEVEQDHELKGDILVNNDGKKIMKSKIVEEVKRVRKNSRGEDEVYYEKVERDVYYELDDDGNVKEEIKDVDQSLKHQFSQNKKMVKVKKKQQVKKQRKNSKGEIEDYMEEISFEEEMEINIDEEIDQHGNVVKKKKKKMVQKQRKNSKGEIENYFEQISDYSFQDPNQQQYNSSQEDIDNEQNNQYLKKMEQEVLNEQQQQGGKSQQLKRQQTIKQQQLQKEKSMKNIELKDPKVITKEDGKQVVSYRKIVKKQRLNSKTGKMEEYEVEEQIDFELKANETLDKDGNIVDKNTGRILKDQKSLHDQIKQQQLLEEEQNIDNFQMQTGLELVWPIIENILEGELNIDPKKIEEIRKKYFDKDSDPKIQNLLYKKGAIQYYNLTGNTDYKLDDNGDIIMPKILQNNTENNNNTDDKKKTRFQQPQQNQDLSKVQGQYMDPKTEELMKLFEPPLNDEEREREENELFNRALKVLEDKALLTEPTIKKMYLHLRQAKDRHGIDVRTKIRKFYGKEGDGYVTYDEFKNYYLKLMAVHTRCGDGCIHLARFFAKVGFTANKFNRRKELKMAKQKPKPFADSYY